MTIQNIEKMIFLSIKKYISTKILSVIMTKYIIILKIV